ncbi:hypothetical protein O9993_16950 [Vibrio lentus]|nr:hypothetical protein [Vibrio lentus]
MDTILLHGHCTTGSGIALEKKPCGKVKGNRMAHSAVIIKDKHHADGNGLKRPRARTCRCKAAVVSISMDWAMEPLLMIYSPQP